MIGAVIFVTATATCTLDAERYLVAEPDKVCVSTSHKSLHRAQKFLTKNPEYKHLYFVDGTGSFYEYRDAGKVSER